MNKFTGFILIIGGAILVNVGAGMMFGSLGLFVSGFLTAFFGLCIKLFQAI